MRTWVEGVGHERCCIADLGVGFLAADAVGAAGEGTSIECRRSTEDIGLRSELRAAPRSLGEVGSGVACHRVVQAGSVAIGDRTFVMDGTCLRWRLKKVCMVVVMVEGVLAGWSCSICRRNVMVVDS